MSEQKYLQMYRSKSNVNTSVFLFLSLAKNLPGMFSACMAGSQEGSMSLGFLLGAVPFVLLPRASISQL